MPDPAVVLIEDEPQIRRFLRATLTGQGYRLFEATTGAAGLVEVGSRQPDVVIVDLGLPDMDGLDVIRRLREWTAIPIIVLSARGQERDKVMALDAGADDYVSKPFGAGELLARIRVALRHAVGATREGDETPFTVGELHVDLVRRQVFVGGKEVHFTPIEYKLLTTLVRHAGRVLTPHPLPLPRFPRPPFPPLPALALPPFPLPHGVPPSTPPSPQPDCRSVPRGYF